MPHSEGVSWMTEAGKPTGCSPQHEEILLVTHFAGLPLGHSAPLGVNSSAGSLDHSRRQSAVGGPSSGAVKHLVWAHWFQAWELWGHDWAVGRARPPCQPALGCCGQPQTSRLPWPQARPPLDASVNLPDKLEQLNPCVSQGQAPPHESCSILGSPRMVQHCYRETNVH